MTDTQVPGTTKGLLALAANALSEFQRKAIAPFPHGFISEVKASQPKQFRHLPVAELKAQSAIEYLEDNIGGYFTMIEGSACPLSESAFAGVEEMPGIPEVCSFIVGSGVVRIAMGQCMVARQRRSASVYRLTGRA